MAALLVTGVLRIQEGSHNHRPTGYLSMLFAVSVLICFALLRSMVIRPPRATRLGAVYLRRLRKAQRAGFAAPFGPALAGAFAPGAQGFAPGMTAGGAALFGVALLGFAAVPDADLRSALLAGMPTSSSGSSCSGGRGMR
jgi:uncharacterized protein (TIGR04222 family)